MSKSKYVTKAKGYENTVVPRSSSQTAEYYDVASGRTLYYDPTIKQTYLVSGDTKEIVKDLGLTPTGSASAQKNINLAQAQVRQDIQDKVNPQPNVQPRPRPKNFTAGVYGRTIVGIEKGETTSSEGFSTIGNEVFVGRTAEIYQSYRQQQDLEMRKSEAVAEVKARGQKQFLLQAYGKPQPQTEIQFMPIKDNFSYSSTYQPVEVYKGGSAVDVINVTKDAKKLVPQESELTFRGQGNVYGYDVAVQKDFDKQFLLKEYQATKTKAGSFAFGAAAAFATPVIHPIQTLKGFGVMGYAAINPTTPSSQKFYYETGYQIKTNPYMFAGGLAGSALLFKGVETGLKLKPLRLGETKMPLRSRLSFAFKESIRNPLKVGRPSLKDVTSYSHKTSEFKPVKPVIEVQRGITPNGIKYSKVSFVETGRAYQTLTKGAKTTVETISPKEIKVKTTLFKQTSGQATSPLRVSESTYKISRPKNFIVKAYRANTAKTQEKLSTKTEWNEIRRQENINRVTVSYDKNFLTRVNKEIHINTKSDTLINTRGIQGLRASRSEIAVQKGLSMPETKVQPEFLKPIKTKLIEGQAKQPRVYEVENYRTVVDGKNQFAFTPEGKSVILAEGNRIGYREVTKSSEPYFVKRIDTKIASRASLTTTTSSKVPEYISKLEIESKKAQTLFTHQQRGFKQDLILEPETNLAVGKSNIKETYLKNYINTKLQIETGLYKTKTMIKPAYVFKSSLAGKTTLFTQPKIQSRIKTPSKVKTFEEMKYSLKVPTQVKINTKIETRLETKQETKTQTKQLTRTLTKTTVMPKFSFKPIPIRPVKTPVPKLFPPFHFPKKGVAFKQEKGLIPNYNPKRAYNPSLVARVFNIKGKPTKLDIAGFGIQPL